MEFHLWSAVTAASTSRGDGTGPKSILGKGIPAFLSIAWISLPWRKLLQVSPPQLQVDETTEGDLKAIEEEEEEEEVELEMCWECKFGENLKDCPQIDKPSDFFLVIREAFRIGTFLFFFSLFF